MRRIAGHLASMMLAAASLAACNALTGASDLSPCASCEIDATTPLGAGGDASGDVVTGARDAAATVDARDATPSADAAAGADASDADSATVLGCLGAVACTRVVFVTSVEYPGNLGGIAGADAKCQARADVSPIPTIKGRMFQAWVSTSVSAVSSRFVHGSMPYVEGDGTIVANDWADLTNGNLNNGIERDELGVLRSTSAWTATSSVNANFTGRGCSDWTSALLVERGSYGNVGGSGGGWSSNADDDCDIPNALYCFEK